MLAAVRRLTTIVRYGKRAHETKVVVTAFCCEMRFVEDVVAFGVSDVSDRLSLIEDDLRAVCGKGS